MVIEVGFYWGGWNKEVLKRLLQINHTRRAEKEADGLWDKEMKKKGKVEKGKVKAEAAQGELF